MNPPDSGKDELKGSVPMASSKLMEAEYEEGEYYHMVDTELYKKMVDYNLDSLDIIKKSKQIMLDYFKEILETDSSEYSLKDICLETLEDYIKLISYGIRFDVLRDNLFQFCVVFQIYSKEKEFLYNYYSYFDANGNLIDNFID